MLAPIALFVYNRPEHTKKVLNALAYNVMAKESDLFIFADGPKPDASTEELKKINKVRHLIRHEFGFRKVQIIESVFNKGIAASIVNGIKNVLEKYDNVIVIEDDILTGRYFLKYCNEALVKYESDNQVMAISGFTFPASKNLPDTFFLSIFACWGWATWKNRWQLFNGDSHYLLDEIKNRNKIVEFNFNNSYNHYGLLQSNIDGKINSWAVCWYASIFLNNGYTLYPSRSLIQNIGMDGTGVHYSRFSKSEAGQEVTISNDNFGREICYTDNIKTDEKIDKKLQKYLHNEQGITHKIKAALKRLFLISSGL